VIEPGAPAPTALRLRPLQVSELLDETFRMYRGNFWLFAGVSLLLAIPGLVANMLAGNFKTFGMFFTLFSNPEAFTRQAQFGPDINPLYLGLSYLIVVLLLPFSAGANLQAAVDVAQGRATSVPAVFGRVLRRYLGIYAVILLNLLVGVLILTCLLIPLVVWILVRWSVAIPALLVEGVGPTAALGRSWNLVRGHWWRLLAIFFVAYLLTSTISSGVGALVGGLAALIPGLSADVRGGAFLTAVTLSSAMVEPVLPIVLTLLYYDLRVRNEAYDLDVLAAAAAPPRPAVGAPGAPGA
jgi:hypothetical protein